MPVYNAENTVSCMIDSILALTYTKWELICENDGSTDGFFALLKKSSFTENRIKVVTKANEGVAMASKIEIETAQGEYSIHADADDWVEPTMLAEMLNSIGDNDVLICDYYVDTEKGSRRICQMPSSLNPHDVLKAMFYGRTFGSLWHKLIRTSLYKEYNARFFKDINHCEDLLIWVQLLQHQNIRIAYLPKAFYHYCIIPSSITRAFTRATYGTRLLFLGKLKELLYLPDFSAIPERVAFGIFTEGFIYDVLSVKEIHEGLKHHHRQIKQVSLRWRLGFMLLSVGWSCIARKLIHF